MHLSRFGLLSLGVAAVDAFKDTSPFFLASTSEVLANSAYIKSGASVLEEVSSSLSSCPSDYYVVVSQPGVHSSDFSTRKSAPRLGTKMLGKDKSIRSKMSVTEVSGLVDDRQIKRLLEDKCKAQTTSINGASGSYPSSFESGPRIIDVQFPMLSLGSDRADQLSDNDGILSDIIERIPSSSKYTLLYITSPREFPETDSVVYDTTEEYGDSIRMELKRDYSAHTSSSSSNSTGRTVSLFDEYQYFTPGIFMGLLASSLFIVILYIGISALSSLQVPYAAFEKDTSAAIQKKAQLATALSTNPCYDLPSTPGQLTRSGEPIQQFDFSDLATMRFLPSSLEKTRSSFILLLFLVLAAVARVSAEPAGTETTASTSDAQTQTTADQSAPSGTETTSTSTKTTSTSTSTSESTTSESTSTTTAMATTSTTSTTSSLTSSLTSTTDGTTATTAVSTTTTASASSTTTNTIATIPPTAGAPYMQTEHMPEGTFFIIIGAILGCIGLGVLAWRGMVAWSVNRSVRNAALVSTAESKRLLRGSRKKRTPVYSAAPKEDVLLDKVGTTTRTSYRPSPQRASTNSSLFFSPTAGGHGASHTNLNRNSTYLPAGYYAAAGNSTPVRDPGLSSPVFSSGSPALTPTGTFNSQHPRQYYAGASTSSLNLNQTPQGRAPSAYLDDLFENHTSQNRTSPRDLDSGHR
ncbi:BIG/ATPase V1 complex subunit S1 [Penicillium taxi]|uniref:BIG/ATPase V1 complex subunit S1 n=1 Tax=Penicillium taxi TaxID=168475 RepID=UPI002545461D|nr:BIG/ATPase V1 complex subunit S1 [Penicillium taxi]KAJ5902302.1 BIG/ATPase V1 complex subunit S1 [Penicillium taxi]